MPDRKLRDADQGQRSAFDHLNKFKHRKMSEYSSENIHNSYSGPEKLSGPKGKKASANYQAVKSNFIDY